MNSSWIDCKLMLHFCLNFNENCNFSGIRFTLVLVKNSMNLFDQLVIIIDDPDMEG